ncbi:MAG: hypothetical protein RMK57_13310 [Bryobacterales bacterium]|nr:hypothetical protein [Bryobacteraceae bacterium]MDW8355496.1 hypothetical protein [Bryobacterales bacterium]
MLRAMSVFLLACIAAVAQYKLEATGAPPEDLDPAIRQILAPSGHRILRGDGSVYCEIWFRASAPSGAPTSEQNVSLTTVPHGALLGAIRFLVRGQDRRGQPILPGVYTLRLSFFPPDGNHQGVAPQRDFLLLIPAAEDKDPNATPSYAEVVAMSKKTTKGGHPAILSLWKDDSGRAPSLVQEGESDWVLYTKVGDLPIGVILIGVYTG